jgi:hypothetical protein
MLQEKTEVIITAIVKLIKILNKTDANPTGPGFSPSIL